MSKQTFQETIVSQKAAGTAYNTYTTAKSVINQTDLVQLPPNYLEIVGGSNFGLTNDYWPAWAGQGCTDNAPGSTECRNAFTPIAAPGTDNAVVATATGRGQCNGEVRGNRRLPHPAFSGGDGDRVPDPLKDRAALRVFVLPDIGRHRDVHVFHAADCFTDGLHGGGLELLPDRTGGRRQFDREADVISGDDDVFDEFQRHNIPAQIRVLDAAKRLQDIPLVQRLHAARLPFLCG